MLFRVLECYRYSERSCGRNRERGEEGMWLFYGGMGR